jgi:hypothetical protein
MNKLIYSKPLAMVAAVSLVLTTTARAQVLTDIGATAPTPGPNDIAQLTFGNVQPPSLNYYWNASNDNGQTFRTLDNPSGYVLNSLAIQTAGGGGGTSGQWSDTQTFTLNIYKLSGTGLTSASLVATFTATSALVTQEDWMQWTGLAVPLAPNTAYAYGFGAGIPGDNLNWEEFSSASGLPYAGGQACQVPPSGGTVVYSSTPNTYDATFDIGLALSTAPVSGQPLVTPSYASQGVVVGGEVTLSAAASGEQPLAYQWQTDGGSGGTLTNIPGATGSNYVVNTTGFTTGPYQYGYVASNSEGTSTSPELTLTVVSVLMADIGSDAPTPGPTDICQLLNTSQNDDGINYYTDKGANNDEWCGQTFTTGTNQQGYVLASVAWKSAGNGQSFDVTQLYDLYIYALSDGGSNATVVASYQGNGGGSELDWFEWMGLNVSLKPNALYAYAFGRDSTSTGWEHIADQGGSPYAGGEICQIPAAGGLVEYGDSGDTSATFDLGIVVATRPVVNTPTYAPNVTPIYAATTVTLSEDAVGVPPIRYQWLTDNGNGGSLVPVSGAASSNLVVNTASFATANYNYAVVVSDSSGSSTSAPVALNVVAASAPQVVTDISPAPANQGYVGQSVTFSATFTGTLPITYQWMVDTGSGPEPILVSDNPSAVSNTLVLDNLQSGNAGTYSVNAVNSVGGPVASSSSTLTVLADPAAPASGTYQALILSNNPAAYWPFDETNNPTTGILPAYDASGHNLDGLYGANSQNGFDDIAGPTPPDFPGFAANNLALSTLAGTAHSWVSVPPINLDTNAVTITMWINPNSPIGASTGLLLNRNGTDAAGFNFGTTVNATTGVAELGYTWNTNSSDSYDFHSGLYPVVGMWSFVALVVQTNQAIIYLYYLDPGTGQPDLYSAVNPIAHTPESFGGGTTLIGDDPADVGSTSPTRVFAGAIDEVAVFKAALTSDQILAQFRQAAKLGAVAPSITGQPQSVGVYAGSNVTFTVTGVNGSSPLTCQWQQNNSNLADAGNISGAKTSTLIISNVTSANAGSYHLLIENAAGSIASSNATLTVITPVAGSYEAEVMADRPYFYWKLNETNDPSVGGVLARDYVRGINGVYQTGALNGFDDILGPEAPSYPGFPTNNTALGTLAGVANSYVTASVGGLASGNLTYAMWINPSGPVKEWTGLLMDRGAAGEGLGFGGSSDATGMAELAYTWNQNSTWRFDSLLYPPANQWSLVVMVIEPSQGTLYLVNSNGVQTAVNAVPQDSEEFGVAWHLGDDPADSSGSGTFPGSIADVSVFLSSLTSSQVTALYNAGAEAAKLSPVRLYFTPASAGSMTLTWAQGTLLESTNVSGPWTPNGASSPYITGATNSSLFYKVLVQP